MNESLEPSKRPIEEVAVARDFYAGLGQKVGYFSALWHTFNVGHMLAVDLDRICRQHGISFADFNLLGALRIDHPRQLRSSDLAVTLQVSNGALTSRIGKLAEKGLLTKTPAPDDRRAFTLELTPKAVVKIEAIFSAIELGSRFVREVSKLPDADRAALDRIMGVLHTQLDRHFTYAHR